MTEYEESVRQYNSKIETLREDCENLSEETLDRLIEIARSMNEEFIYDLTVEISDDPENANAEDYDLTSDFSSAFYQLDLIREAAQKEKEFRKDLIRESPEYRKAMNYLEVVSEDQFVSWNHCKDQINKFADSEVAEVAIKDGKEKFE